MSGTRRVRLVGFDATIFNLGAIAGSRLTAAVEAALTAAGDIAKGEVYRNITRSDHSYSQLRALDHPYARRHGSINIHSGEEHVVHTHTGRMAASLKGGLVRGGKNPLYRIDFGSAPPPYVRHVVMGTRVMLPRDVLLDSVSAPHMQPVLMRAFVRVMGAQFRSQAGLRFVL